MINDVKRVKDFNIQYISGIWGDYSSEENDDGIFVLRSTEQKLNGELNIINPAYIKADYKSKNILREGDLLITKSSGSKSHVGKCSYISKEVASCKYAFSNFMIGIRVKDRKLAPEYLYFCINSKLIKRQIERNSMNVTLNNLNQNNISNWFIPFFNIDIQKNIVIFLRNEIKIIDKKLKKYNKKIELLKEYKESLIYETVTKGLDKNVEMKDSGIDWIGLIPKSFSIKRLKDVYIYKNGYSFSDEDYSEEDNGNYLIKITQIKEEGININKEMVIKENYRNKLFKIKKMSILYALSGATAGKSCFFDSEYKCYLNQRVAEIRLKKGNSKYLYYIFKNKQMQNIILNSKQSTAQPNINKSDIDNFIIPYISNTNKQNEIVNFLDKKTKEIDSEVKKIYKKIELIKELKESIIYECVTGKLDIEKEGEKYQKIIESI